MSGLLRGSAAFTSRRRALALWTVLAAQLMLAMDLMIVVVALPRIQVDLGFSAAGLTWVINAFGIAFGGLLLLGGRLGDMIGQVRAFRMGLTVFVAASLLGGIAQEPWVLIMARVFQGGGAALAAPSVLALVMVMARNEAEQAKGLSMFIAVSSTGASAGLILGGVLTELLSWRWALLINVPVGVLVVIAIGRLVAETHPRRSRLDYVGALTGTIASGALTYGFISAADNGWAAVGTLFSFVAAALLLGLFIQTERVHPNPLLNLSLLQDRSRLAALTVMAVIVGMHFAMLFMLVQYLQRVLGWTPFAAGLGYLPLTLAVAMISRFAPRLIARFGSRALLISGSLVVALSMLGFAFLAADSRYFPAVLVPLLIHAIGVALIFAPGTVAIMHGVPEEHAGAVSGLLQMDQQIGGALGIAVITSIYAAVATPDQFASGLSAAFVGGAMIASLGAVIAWKAGTQRAAREQS
ncbi:MFS transporter [Novosphingobium sp. AP12]|uniref:MFS transporter n=1 Tax=Novosphingobium sp. AP12 TaxID=1144305 RepID=UPI000271F5DD|nr:MFS transporter [Novosphingobium sp. AP12]EJL33104.1 arabinose efflux permease family protein [Novosphingobium sp. AP12]